MHEFQFPTFPDSTDRAFLIPESNNPMQDMLLHPSTITVSKAWFSYPHLQLLKGLLIISTYASLRYFNVNYRQFFALLSYYFITLLLPLSCSSILFKRKNFWCKNRKNLVRFLYTWASAAPTIRSEFPFWLAWFFCGVFFVSV